MENKQNKSIDDFFKETFSEEFLKEADVEYILAKIAGLAYRAKENSNLSFREIAKKMGLKSPAMVQRIVNEADPHNITLSTLVRFGKACGCNVDIEFNPIKQAEQWENRPLSTTKYYYNPNTTYHNAAGIVRESTLENTSANCAYQPSPCAYEVTDNKNYSQDFESQLLV